MAKKRFFRFRLSLGWVVVLAVLAGGYVYMTRPEKLPVVMLTDVMEGPVVRILALNGRIRAPDRAQILPEIQGRIIEMNKDDGDTMKKGEVLARLEAGEEEAALQQAKSALSAKKLEQAQAARELKRGQGLVKSGYVSKQTLETLKLAVTRSEQDVARLEAAVAQAEAALADSVITAPFDGVVLDREADLGQTVDSRTVIFEVVANGVRDIEAESDEVYSAALSVGQPVTIIPAGLQETELPGKISFISPDIDIASGGRRLRVSAENLDDLPPGLSVSLSVLIEERQSALTIPRTAVIDPRGGARVRMVDATGAVTEREVKVVDWPAERVIVESGLAAGEKVIVMPRLVQPGVKVDAKPLPPMTPESGGQ